MSNFSSDGFDLDAVPDAGTTSGDDVVYELGGSATVHEEDKKAVENDAITTNAAKEEEEVPPIARSEELKGQGNEAFKEKNYLEAYDMYTAAMEACPGMKGEKILELRDKFDEEERAKLYERQRQRRQVPTTTAEKGSENKSADPHQQQQQEEAVEKPKEFKAPHHPHGKELSIYHCNRAACKLHLESYEDAVKDCDISILLRPDWAKAYIRRSTANEKLEHTDLALADSKKALELDPNNNTIKSTVKRLQKIEDERLEKLKEETIGKLKDLGNSILGNFGLSLDNFQAKQDPNTGSYSISFDQGAGKK